MCKSLLCTDTNVCVFCHAYLCSAHPQAVSGRLRAEVCDITRQPLPPSQAASGGYDFALCMFVLSALPPKVGIVVVVFWSSLVVLVFVTDANTYYYAYDSVMWKYSRSSVTVCKWGAGCYSETMEGTYVCTLNSCKAKQ